MCSLHISALITRCWPCAYSAMCTKICHSTKPFISSLRGFLMSFRSYFMIYNRYCWAPVICAFIKQRHKNPITFVFLSSLGFFKWELWCTMRKAQTSSNSKSRKYQWKPVSQGTPNLNTWFWKIQFKKNLLLGCSAILGFLSIFCTLYLIGYSQVQKWFRQSL